MDPRLITDPPVSTINETATATKKRIFISYKRKELDEEVAMQVFSAFATEHDVFIDQTMPVGTNWADRIEGELRNSDYLIVFLSARSVNSQMVKSEISTAHRLAQEGNGRPTILPVRLDYKEPFQYPLSAYLDPINWAFWRGPDDTLRIIQELKRAISGGQLSITLQSNKDSLVLQEIAKGEQSPDGICEPLPDAQPTVGKQRPLQSPHRPADFKSDLYMVRESDRLAEMMIRQSQATITIKGPEQRGKSSLLFRTLDAAMQVNKKIAFLDFQLLDRKSLADEDRFYQDFCAWISDEAEVADKTEEYWLRKRSNVQFCTEYMGKHVLPALGDDTLLLAIDEAETVTEAEFSVEFFTMLRHWSERRGIPKFAATWQRLDMIFVVSTEPYNLLNEPDRSPFNVGDPIILEDFNSKQIAQLNELHNSPLTLSQVEKLSELLCGHPYLIRRALFLVANKTHTPDDLFTKAADAYGPFGDHLRYHLFELRKSADLVEELNQILDHKKSLNKMASHQLRGAGLICGSDNNVKLSCLLYEQFFRRHLNV